MEWSNETEIPRPEHPNPQFRRSRWKNLNGIWDFSLDLSASGMDRAWYAHPAFSQKIRVPFCPESQESGVGFTDFIPCCWYRRTFSLTQDELAGVVYLHFGAVDYEAHVFVNGTEAGTHKGGYASFQLEISSLLKAGENELVVCAFDRIREQKQPAGKQCDHYASYSCLYTRTTGIWQTVWLEFAPAVHLRSVRYYPNIAENSVTIQAETAGSGTLRAQAFFDGRPCGEGAVHCENGTAMLHLQLTERHLWQPGEGNLYDLVLTLGEDTVNSYFGLREIRLDGYRFLINGVSVFQRLVLDQGFYPSGIYTAPTAADLERDILLSQEAGFNGARLHEKVFEPLFLYYCDRRGYLVWGEMASWGFDISRYSGYEIFVPEWMEVLQRDFNHPAIIGWCPFNETWDYCGRRQLDGLVRHAYRVTKLFDRTRPCIDTSGHYHVETDIYDLHDYEQSLENFCPRYVSFGKGESPLPELYPDRQHYPGNMPFFISEYGGIKWTPDAGKAEPEAWGYGEQANSEEEFLARYRGLTESLLQNPRMFGFCFTQLYDVEQECNGIYTYDRRPKADVPAIRSINAQKAAIES